MAGVHGMKDIEYVEGQCKAIVHNSASRCIQLGIEWDPLEVFVRCHQTHVVKGLDYCYYHLRGKAKDQFLHQEAIRLLLGSDWEERQARLAALTKRGLPGGITPLPATPGVMQAQALKPPRPAMPTPARRPGPFDLPPRK